MENSNAAELLRKWGLEQLIQTFQEQRKNLAVFTLPLLFTGRRKLKGGKISTSESTSSFIDFQCESTGLDQYLSDIDKASKSQPYILILGGTLLKPQQVFVIVERKALPQSSLIKALDVCFKAYFILDSEYQDRCVGVWEFMAAIVFGLHKGILKCNKIREFRAYCFFQ